MNIYQKLIEVRKSVPYLQKEKEGQQYKFVGHDQAVTAVRSKMDELGLLLIPSIVDTKVTTDTIEWIDRDKPKRTTTYFTELTLNMRWINAEKPEEYIDAPWYAQGVDIAGEKGVGKALTYGEKYFILRQFNIPSDKEDPDQFQRRQEQKQEQQDKRRLLNLTAEIKTKWVSRDLKPQALNAQMVKLYGVGIDHITEEQAAEFLDRLEQPA